MALTYTQTLFTNLAALSTTTSATPATLLTTTFTTTGVVTLILYASTASQTSASTAVGTFTVRLDGVGKTTQITRIASTTNAVGATAQLSITVANVAPGSHTVDLQWSVNGGATLTIDPTDAGGLNNHATLMVVVLNQPIFEEFASPIAPQPPDQPPNAIFIEQQQAAFLVTDDPFKPPPLPPDQSPDPVRLEEQFGTVLVSDDTFRPAVPPPDDVPRVTYPPEDFATFPIYEDGYVPPPLPPDQPPDVRFANEDFLLVMVSEDGYVVPPLPPEPPPVPPPPPIDEPFFGVVVSEDGYVLPSPPDEPPRVIVGAGEDFLALVLTEDGYLVPPLPDEPVWMRPVPEEEFPPVQPPPPPPPQPPPGVAPGPPPAPSGSGGGGGATWWWWCLLNKDEPVKRKDEPADKTARKTDELGFILRRMNELTGSTYDPLASLKPSPADKTARKTDETVSPPDPPPATTAPKPKSAGAWILGAFGAGLLGGYLGKSAIAPQRTRKGYVKANPLPAEEDGPPPGANVQERMIKCGNPRCKSCPHGPYYYANWKGSDGKTKWKYLGKKKPR